MAQKIIQIHKEDNIMDSTRIVIYCGSIIHNDAIGNDILLQYQYLNKYGIDADMFALNSDEDAKKLLVSKEIFIDLIQNKNNLLLIHYGMYWEGLLDYIKIARCTIIFKYHNITPSNFFDNYNKYFMQSLEESRKKLEEIIQTGYIDYYWADSHYNAEELKANNVNADNIAIIPPFHRVHDFDNVKIDVSLEKQLKSGLLNLLFVGRVAPNKGHVHLIETIRSYKKIYGNNIHLNIIGSISCELRNYYKDLRKLINDYDLNDMISFYNHITFEQLNTFYATADIFLLMSEHEGFCVPILEAQYHNVPIIALDRAAIKETLGMEQLIYEKVDYDVFASAIYTLTTDKEIHSYLAKQGYNNFLKYESVKIIELMLTAIKNIIDIKE